jgi:membrane protein implicated in regulation of membrane protease activity
MTFRLLANLEALDSDLIVTVSLLSLAVAALCLAAGKLGRWDFESARWWILLTALVFAVVLAVPYLARLVGIRVGSDREDEVQAAFGAIQGLFFLVGVLLVVFTAYWVRRLPEREPVGEQAGESKGEEKTDEPGPDARD